ncbi:MAG TPA: hypothetical protein VK204_00575, partial [Nocardioidaceae bacterium]|nr:hypothetical protein [Nocardioidaceae bacterium]
HGRWTLTQTGPGSYEWSTPHGYRFAVDQHGTHPLGKADPEQARAPQQASAPQTAPETTRSAGHRTRESAHETHLAELVDRALPLRTLRGRVTEAAHGYEIYEIDYALDLSGWQHSA